MPGSAKVSLGAHPFLYPKPAFLIASYDAEGKPNVMTAAWAGICSSKPLSLYVSVQPVRYTYEAILARKAFTVGIATENMVKETDYAGIVSGRRYDKLEQAGLTAVKAEHVDAPYIAECPVILECSLSTSLELGMHTLMIAEIIDVKADKNCLDASGTFPDIQKVAPLIFDSGSKSYFGVGSFVAKAFSAGKALLK